MIGQLPFFFYSYTAANYSDILTLRVARTNISLNEKHKPTFKCLFKDIAFLTFMLFYSLKKE